MRTSKVRSALASFPRQRRVPDDSGFARKVGGMMSKDITPTTLERACQIMSPVYSIEDIQNVFGVSYTEEHIASLQIIPFSEAVLAECAGTHMLFPGFPMSLLQVHKKFAYLFSAMGGWCENHPFAKTNLVRPSWDLLRMDPVPMSHSKTWAEQLTLLRPDEGVPSAALVAFATMLHFKVSGHRLFEDCYVRTSDVNSHGLRVDVGEFDADGFVVYGYEDGCRSSSFGLSSFRKS